jgi:hypothetical protein
MAEIEKLKLVKYNSEKQSSFQGVKFQKEFYA